MKKLILFLLLLLQSCNLFAPVDPLPPMVATEAPTGVFPTGFVAKGTITGSSFKNSRQEKKSGDVIEYGFILTNGSSRDTVKKGSSLSSSPLSFEHSYGGLASNKKYSVQAYAKNEGGGFAAGTDIEVTTGSFTLPTLTTGTPTGVGTNAATVTINISGLGNAPASQSGVCYSSSVVPPTTAQSKVIISASPATGHFSANLTSLAANTKYYVRGYVITGAGVAYGNTVEFTTGAPIPTDGVFIHKVGAATTASKLDDRGLDGNPNAIIMLTANYEGTNVYSPVPLAVNYASGKWSVVNQDGSSLPANANYNIYYTAPSKTAYRHTATATNTYLGTSVYLTTLDHPLLNDKPNARLLATRVRGTSTANSSSFGLFFTDGRWRIYHQTVGKTIVPGTEFNIIIDDRVFSTLATAANISGNYFNITPTLATVKSRVFVSNLWNGVYNTSELGVWLNSGKWSIFNQTRTAMPVNSSYFVLAL